MISSTSVRAFGIVTHASIERISQELHGNLGHWGTIHVSVLCHDSKREIRELNSMVETILSLLCSDPASNSWVFSCLCRNWISFLPTQASCLFYPIACSSGCIILNPEGSDPLISTSSLGPLFPAGPVPMGLFQDLWRGCLIQLLPVLSWAAANTHSRSPWPDCPVSRALKLWTHPSSTPTQTLGHSKCCHQNLGASLVCLSQPAALPSNIPGTGATPQRDQSPGTALTLPRGPGNTSTIPNKRIPWCFPRLPQLGISTGHETVSGREQRFPNNQCHVQTALLSTSTAAETTNNSGALLWKRGL